MWQPFLLLIPALIPSWRFFKSVEPSPRVQFAWLAERSHRPKAWQVFANQPAALNARVAAGQLFWNPKWNEGLYLVTLSERLMAAPTRHSVTEIIRILRATHVPHPSARYLQFRILCVRREGTDIVEEVTYLSDPHEL